jgi:hypothetical protein
MRNIVVLPVDVTTALCIRRKARLVFGELVPDLRTASLTVRGSEFYIGGNKYRLISRLRYAAQRVLVLNVMTHREYDQDDWKDVCGCLLRQRMGRKRQRRVRCEGKGHDGQFLITGLRSPHLSRWAGHGQWIESHHALTSRWLLPGRQADRRQRRSEA